MKKYIILLSYYSILSCTNQQNNATSPDTKKDSSKVKATILQTETPALTILSFNKYNTPLKDSVKGKIVDGSNFQDAEGESTIILTETENIYKGNTQNKSIYAYCFTKQSNGYKSKWLVQDKTEACDFDATCEFFPGSLAVTDIDSNHVAEISFIYKRSCRSDVSPDSKKLIMYEGMSKYAIRGTTTIIFTKNGGKEGGDKRADDSFANAPKSLLEFANRQWDKFGLIKY